MAKNNQNQTKKKKLHGVSINELAVLYYLLPYGFKRGTKGSLQHLGLGYKEIDVYNESLKIGIEYDGYLHTDAKDSTKNRLCASAGITLLRIRESCCSRLTDNLSTNFYLCNDKPLSAALSVCIKDVCVYINSISNLNIDITTIDCVQDSKKIFDFIDKHYVINRVGEVNISACGQKMTIIKYCTSCNIDVQFDDGTIVKRKHYNSFLSGSIRNPNYRVGEKKKARNGQMMTIVDFLHADDIAILFEDGTVVRHKKYDDFLKGCVRNPNYRIGEQKIAHNGQLMTIIAYKTTENIDVRFEDGTIVTKKKYDDFLRGRIRNPSVKTVYRRAG